MREATQQASERMHSAQDAGHLQALLDSTDQAVSVGKEQVFHALVAFDLQGEGAFLAMCRGFVEREQFADALDCLEQARWQSMDTLALGLVHADALMGLEQYEDAREVLFNLRDRFPTDTGLNDPIVRAFADDPLFLREVVTIERGNQITEIDPLGGGSTITFKFRLDGETIAAFKPNQTRRQSNYRAEVAAFRLCPIIRCGFEVPFSFEVRVEQRDFMRLYGIRSLEGNTGYSAQFGDLIWTESDGETYLYGVWKDWVPHFAQFPLEYDDVWDSWVDVDGDPSELDIPLDEALLPLRGREDGSYTEVIEEAGDATTREMARQLSNMMVFDFLINNWDRFSGAYFGVNCQWAEGRFVSIDNGAGFMTREPDRPRSHLHQVSRFSRSSIGEIRQLDPELLLPILFPNPTDDEMERFEVFWQRRQELLDYVDELIEERGEDAVLFFD